MKKKLLVSLVSSMVAFGSVLPNVELINANTYLAETTSVDGTGVSRLVVGERFTVDSVSYELVSSDEVVVADCDVAETSVRIEKTVTNPNDNVAYKILGIRSNAFQDCTNLRMVNLLSSNITFVNAMAFQGCTSLTRVTFPKCLTSIGESAFRGCTKLRISEIPEGVTTIEDETFYGCTSLTTVEIPKDVVSIGDDAFYNCNSLTDVELPSKLQTIGSHAFYCCTSLTSITLPDTLTSIGVYGFSVTGLQSIVLPGSITSMFHATFRDCVNLESVIFEEGMTSTGVETFFNCKKLNSVTLPSTMTDIGAGAFRQCYSLAEIAIPENVDFMGFAVFQDCTSLQSINIPKSVTSITGNSYLNCTSLTSATIQSNTTTVATDSFTNCSPDLVMGVRFDSPALEYAKTNTIDYILLDVEDLRTKVADAKNYQEADYVSTTYQELQDAITNAETALAASDHTKDIIEPATTRLDDAVNSLVQLADYTKVDEAVARANALTQSDYLDFSNVTAAIDAVNDDLGVPQQNDVDAYATAIDEAVASLVNIVELKQNYDAAEAIDENDYTVASWNELAEKIQEVNTMLSGTTASQEEVNAANEELLEAVEKLVQAGDTTELDSLLNSVPSDETKYTADSWTNLNSAITSANEAKNNRGSKVEIDLAVAQVRIAKEGLVDRSGLKTSIDEAGGKQEATYTTSTWEVLNNAVQAAQEVYNKVNATKDEVSSIKTILDKAIASLKQRGNTTALEAAIASAPAEGDANKYSANSWADYIEKLNAANDVVTNKADKEQVAIDFAKLDLQLAKDALVNISVLQALIDEANAIDKANRTQESIAVLDSAIDGSEAVVGKADATKEEVSNSIKVLENAISALEYQEADYSDVDAAIERANGLTRSNYVDFSAVTNAIKAVEEDKNITEQTTVDGYATAINSAIEALVLKAADYSAVDEAKARANALTPSDYADFSAVTDAINAVVEDKDITEQEIVDGYAKAINDAIDKLEKLEDVTNKENLEKAIKKAELYDPLNLTVEQNEKIATSLASAYAIMAKKDATQEQIDEATNVVKEAIENIKPKSTFEDVDSAQWYAFVVDEAYARGLMGATNEEKTLFKPNDNITRGMVATILYRMAGTPKVTFNAKFPDVKANLWYSNAIIWASNVEVVSGFSDGTFGPDKEITRQDLAVMLRNYATKVGKLETKATVNLTKFADADMIDKYAYSALQWAVENKIISGKEEGKKIAAKDNATRAECAKMFTMLQDLIIE